MTNVPLDDRELAFLTEQAFDHAHLDASGHWKRGLWRKLRAHGDKHSITFYKEGDFSKEVRAYGIDASFGASREEAWYSIDYVIPAGKSDETRTVEAIVHLVWDLGCEVTVPLEEG